MHLVNQFITIGVNHLKHSSIDILALCHGCANTKIFELDFTIFLTFSQNDSILNSFQNYSPEKKLHSP
jgi:hypothetical protein